MFVIVVVGMLIGYAALATSTPADFANAINGYGGSNLTFQGVISAAQASGWTYAPLSFATTLVSIPFSILLFNGFNYSAAASGEIKRPERSMMIGIIGALIFGLIVNVIGMQLAINVIGYPFFQASGYLYANGKWPLPAEPWLGLLISPLIHNPILLILVQLGWLIMLPWELIALSLVCTRYSFAFAFDRVLPVRLANINDRFSFPVNSSILNFVIGAIFLALTTWTTYLGLYLNQVTIWSSVWFLSSLVAVVLPHTRFKELVKSLPGANWKVPFLSIVGLLSMVSMAVTFYYAVSTPAIGPSTVGADLMLAVIFLVGAGVYIASYYYNKSRGIDLNLIYSVIPPE
jgi:amino acid transporter